MNIETTLTYSEKLIRNVVFVFWRRTIGGRFFVAWIITSACFAFLLAQGETSWLVGALGTILVLCTLFVVAIYFVHYRNSLAKLRDMGSSNATFSANDISFTISSDAGNATLQWSVVKELWQTQTAWLLLYSKAHFTTLPIACLSAEMQTYILDRVKAAGGKIVG